MSGERKVADIVWLREEKVVEGLRELARLRFGDGAGGGVG